MNQAQTDKRVLVWDLPIRIFHWLFAGTITLALAFALGGEHTEWFPWHMILGVYAGFLLVVRLVLGMFGSKHNRLKELLVSPLAAGRHAIGMALGNAKRYAGHNPLASLSYVAMFALLALVILTGLLMESEFAEESHEVFAYALLATIVAHLLGIAYHTWRFRENVALSMVTGRKTADVSESLPNAKPALGLATLAVSLAVMGALFSGFDPESQKLVLPVTGATLSLGEGEEHENRGERRHEREAEGHDHD